MRITSLILHKTYLVLSLIYTNLSSKNCDYKDFNYLTIRTTNVTITINVLALGVYVSVISKISKQKSTLQKEYIPDFYRERIDKDEDTDQEVVVKIINFIKPILENDLL